jgi:K(+)-stimulated pyrophosphate-energized sodium pump
MLIAEMLGGYMAGVTVSGVLWAVFQNNAGGAWDNAKKSFEAGVEINGEMTYKGSDAHKAAVTGDTVGDPFKDTSGPSMNILIKLTCLIGLVIAPILGSGTEGGKEGHGACKMEQCDGEMDCHKDMKSCHGGMEACEPHKKGEYMIGKCDMRECAKMSKEECAKMCDEKGCTPEEKEMCLAHYGADGKFMGAGTCEKKGACCADKKECTDKSKCKDKSECKEACKH